MDSKEENMIEQTDNSFKEDMEKHSGKVGSVIAIIIIVILILLVISQIILGVINLNRIYQHEKPYFLVDKKTNENTDNNEVTDIYYFGVYKIILKENTTTKTASLRPWFFKE